MKLPIDGTNYHLVDPTGVNRNWAMIWVRVDVWQRKFVYREWPCRKIWVPGKGYPGVWAEAGQDARNGQKFGGVSGDGAKSFGLGVEGYKNEVSRLERWRDVNEDKPIREWSERNGALEPVRERFIDKRFANSSHESKDGAISLLDVLDSWNWYFTPITGGTGEGRTAIEHGRDLINDALYFQEGWEDIEDPIKQVEAGPKLFIHEDCENVWFALKNYTAKGGQEEACKDWIDLLRYMMHADLRHVDGFIQRRHGGYGVHQELAPWAKAKKQRRRQN